ncbi:hypothetical protein DFH27DRAFT_589178 [Peziza echinospora]|nr:hypothetical protein DFH27DRAFT_589178 [Peziza echinospora]
MIDSVIDSYGNPDRVLLILYGSETGTAQDFAQELGRAAERFRFDTRVLAMNDVDLKLFLQCPLVVFVTSTTGQGDMPANMMSFWKFLLRRKLPPSLLQGLQFTTFGLGDSTYVNFNWAVKKLHKRILQLGGNEVFARGEGDEQHSEGLDGAFIPWSANLFKTLLEKYPLPPGLQAIPDSQPLPPKYVLEFDGDSTGISASNEASTEVHIPRPGSKIATLQHNTRVTPQTHFQDSRHIKFSTDEPISYSPGDVLSLHPQNIPEDVAEFLALQGWDEIADRPLKIVPTAYLLSLSETSKLPIPQPLIAAPVSPLTLRTLLTHHLDITAIPRRSFFSYIANYTDNELHKERLLEFINPEFIDELWDYTTRPRRTIVEVLQEFGSVKLNWKEALLGESGIGLMRERLFSIASSQRGFSTPATIEDESIINGTCRLSLDEDSIPLTHSVELLVAVVKYQTILKKPRTGLCTRWLTSLKPGNKVNIIISPNSAGTGFSSKTLSDELSRPVVMIGPGTGVAPMRSLAWERLQMGKTEGRDVGEMVLLYGCRNKDADYYFKDEWEAWQKDSHGRRKVFVAFSRDQKQKRYVQHLVRENSAIIYRLLHDQEGIVYVCGSSGRMPQSVREALIDIFEKEGRGDNITHETAEKYLAAMERDGRYRQETW